MYREPRLIAAVYEYAEADIGQGEIEHVPLGGHLSIVFSVRLRLGILLYPNRRITMATQLSKRWCKYHEY